MSTILHTTSSARPAHAAGKIAFETDTGNLIISNGISWRAFNYDDAISGTHEFTSNNYSAYFDGTDDYIDTNNKFDFIQQTCNFSISLWVKFANHASTATNQFLVMSVAGGGNVGFMLWYDNRSSSGSNKQLRLLISPGTSMNINNGITDNNWHHIAVTCSATGSLRLYRDGTEIGSQSAPSLNSSAASHNLFLGAAYNPTNASVVNYLNGYLDEVAIFNRELTTTEIDNIIDNKSYDNFSAMYRLENNANDELDINNGTVVGGVTFVSKSNNSTNTPY